MVGRGSGGRGVEGLLCYLSCQKALEKALKPGKPFIKKLMAKSIKTWVQGSGLGGRDPSMGKLSLNPASPKQDPRRSIHAHAHCTPPAAIRDEINLLAWQARAPAGRTLSVSHRVGRPLIKRASGAGFVPLRRLSPCTQFTRPADWLPRCVRETD